MMIVFGGAFNPPTIAHLNIIKKLLGVFPFAKLLVLPVGNDYKKEELVDFEHRYEMLKRTLDGIDRVLISKLEANKTYNGTLESLNALSQTYDQLCFVIGSDHLEHLKTWINYEKLLKSYPLIVMTRKSGLTQKQAETLFDGVEHQFYFIDFEENISSSELRQSANLRKTWLVPSVIDYIKVHKLYVKDVNHV